MKLIRYSLFSLLLLVSASIFGQAPGDGEIFSIKDIRANEASKLLEVSVVARRDNGTDLLSQDASGLSAKMRAGSSGTAYQELTIHSLKPLQTTGTGETAAVQKNMKVLFLMDLSGSMRDKEPDYKLLNAKAAIKDALETGMLGSSEVEFAWFHDDIGPSEPLDLGSFPAVVEPVGVGEPGEGKDTDLHRALKEKLEELKTFEGEKVLILLTDGENDIKRNPNYKGFSGLLPISEPEIISYLETLDESFMVFPVGLGANASESFLRSIAETTVNPADFFSNNVAPKDIGRAYVKIISGLEPNWKILINPPQEDAVFGIEERTMSLTFLDGEREIPAAKRFVLGSNTVKIDLRTGQGKNILLELIIGIILLGLLLAILSISVPMYTDYQFKKEYIRKYREVRVPNIDKRDPLTQEIFQDQDDVVVMDDKMMLLETWKYYKSNNQGIESNEFSELFQFHLGGGFFSQRGHYRRLNWLWFGALGGLLAWGMSEILSGWEILDFTNVLAALNSDRKLIAGSVNEEVTAGMALGFCIVAALATIEEFGQSRKLNILRILMRATIGLIAGFLIFFIEAAVIAKLLPYNYIGGLLGWSIFGTALGLIVSLFSSIEPKNGLKGGLIAGVVAFHFFFLLNIPFVSQVLGSNVVRVISLITYGGVLGFVLHTVVSRLEDFELRTISPQAFLGRVSPISKWLKSPSIDHIHIGKHPDSYVYIKWDDPMAKRHHARLSYVREVVYVEPDEGDVLVNGRQIKSKTALNHQDKIQLGQGSISILQFLAKDGGTSKGKKGKGGSLQSSSGSRSIRVSSRNKKETEKIRKKISIQKRS